MNLQVGYYDPFDIYPLIKPSIDTKLPLTNLHWKINGTIKSIPKLPVDFVEEVPKRFKKSVSLRVMFVKGGDMATYKSQVRPLIKEWLKPQPLSEWLIVLYSPLKKDSRYSLKTSIHEKLKTDFNKDGKQLAPLGVSSGDVDRCFRLKETNDNELNKLEIYNEFIGMLKQLILNGFTKKIASETELIKKAEASHDLLTAINLLIATSKYYQELYLFKEALAYLSELSYKFKQYYKLANYIHDSSIIKFEDIIQTLVQTEDIDFLNESNLFKIFSYIFYQKHLVLLKLIHNEPLISIRATHLTTLYQELIQYLNEVSSIFKNLDNPDNSILFLVYNFKMIDYYLGIQETQDIIQAGAKSADIDLSTIYEYMGDLKLAQRDNLIKLAELKQYFFGDIEELESVPLDSEATSKENLKILDSLDDYDKSLAKILSTKESYFQYFHSLTESIIQNFVPCGRIKSIDVLSIDLALLNYHQKNYQQVINVLQDSFEYFINNGWNYMGNKLLKIYINSVEQLLQKDSDPNHCLLIINSYLKLINNLKLSSKKFDINCQVTANLNESINTVLKDKILPVSEGLSTGLMIPLLSFFEVLVLPNFSFNEDTLKYYLSIQLSNRFNITQTIHSLSIELSNGLVLSCESIDLGEQTNKETQIAIIDAYTNTFIKGFYNPLKLKVNLTKNVTLVHDFKVDEDEPIQENINDTVNGGDPGVKHRRNSILNDSMLMDNKIFTNEHNQLLKTISTHSLYYHQIPNTFKAEIEFSKSYLLGSPSLTIKFTNGYKDQITNVSVEYLQVDGFKLIEKASTQGVGDIKSNSSTEFLKAINVISDGDCYIKVKVNYTMNGDAYEYYYDTVVNCRLIISVTVQDIFKADSIFLNFQIGSIIDSSLRINSIDLNPVDSAQKAIAVEKPSLALENEIILKDQILNSFYKILIKDDQVHTDQTQLQLTINYNSLVYECREYLQEVITTKISDPLVLELFKDIVLPICKYDYNRFVIDGKLTVVNRAEVLKVVEEMGKYISSPSSVLVDAIASDHTIQTLSTIADTVKSQLRIMVPIPHIDILQIVEFHYPKQNQYLVGEPIEMELVIESNTKWEQAPNKQNPNTKKLHSNGDTTEEDLSIIAESSILDDTVTPQEQLFQFNLINDENWSITGFKKKLLLVNLADPVTTNRFSLLLIPLTIGKLSLPKFFLRLVDQSVNLSIDISFKNGNETLLVVPELDKITFSF